MLVEQADVSRNVKVIDVNIAQLSASGQNHLIRMQEKIETHSRLVNWTSKYTRFFLTIQLPSKEDH